MSSIGIITIGENQKIVIAVAISFLVAFCLFYFVFYHLSFGDNADERGFYSNLARSNSNKIFLVGSSYVGQLNTSFIQETLSENHKNYEVYNLANRADKPIDRIWSINDIISAKPKFVFYGIGFRDFETYAPDDVVDGMSQARHSDELLPSPKSALENFFNYKLLGFGMNESPRLLVLSSLEQSFDMKSFPISEQILYNIWKQRVDLQKEFPEVKEGNYENLKKWAMDKGWNENAQLYALTPKGKTPSWAQNDNFIVSIATSESHSPFYVYSQTMWTIENETSAKNWMRTGYFKGFSMQSEEENTNALESMISKFQQNDIKVVLFSAPYSKYYIDDISNIDKTRFISILNNLHEKYHIDVYFLHEKYKNENIFFNPTHVTLLKPGMIYNQDIAQIILNETRS